MPTKNKYFPVVRGKEVGIFTDYENGAQKSVDGFSKNKHQGFVSLEKALQFMSDNNIHEPDIIGNISEEVKEDMRRLDIFDNYDIDGNRARSKNPIASASLESHPETFRRPCFCDEDAYRHPDTLVCVKCRSIVHKTCTYFQENLGNRYICERCKRRHSGNPEVQGEQVAENPEAQVDQVAENPEAQVEQVRQDLQDFAI